MPKVEQVYEGDWEDVTDGRITSCCDCGLTHDGRYTVLDGRILRMIHVDRKRTRNHRRKLYVRASVKMIYKKMFRKRK